MFKLFIVYCIAWVQYGRSVFSPSSAGCLSLVVYQFWQFCFPTLSNWFLSSSHGSVIFLHGFSDLISLCSLCFRFQCSSASLPHLCSPPPFHLYLILVLRCPNHLQHYQCLDSGASVLLPAIVGPPPCYVD